MCFPEVVRYILGGMFTKTRPQNIDIWPNDRKDVIEEACARPREFSKNPFWGAKYISVCRDVIEGICYDLGLAIIGS